MISKDLLTVKALTENKNRTDIKAVWKYGENINIFYLLGILETIKADLLEQIKRDNYKNA